MKNQFLILALHAFFSFKNQVQALRILFELF